jgi:hypothetical protein
MFRTNLATNYIKRTIRPLYGWTQATPKSAFLDPSWDRSVAIWPGFVVTKTTGNNYTLIGSAPVTTAADQEPAGFVGQFIGGAGIDELLESGVNALAVWVLGPDAEFEFLAPAFDPSQNWAAADAGDGVDTLVYASTGGSNQGALVLSADPNASTKPVGRLIQVESANSIIVGGLQVRSA